jgi:hypothetical protein
MGIGADDLCTVLELTKWLPNQSANDAVALQDLITNGSFVILNEYMNRPHILASVLGSLTENFDGNDSDRLLPHNFPLIAVSAVSIDNITIPASSTTGSGFSVGFLSDARRVLLRGFRFNRGVQNITISYTAGYSSVPIDLKQAAIEAFALTYRQRTHIGEKSNSMGGQVTLSFDMSECPPRSMSVFNQYRRVAL